MMETQQHTNQPILFVPGGHGLQPVEVGHTFLASLRKDDEVTAAGETVEEAVANLRDNVSIATSEVTQQFTAKLTNYPEVTAEGTTEDEAVDNLRFRVSLSVIKTGKIE